MNYNNKFPTFSFRIEKYYDQKLTKLASQDKKSRTEFAKTIIVKYLKGELIEKTLDYQTELTKLKIEKIKQEIKYMEIKNNFATNFNRPLSRSATVHIKPEIVVESATKEIIHSPYDAQNKRLQCVECMCLFTWTGKNDFIDQLGEFHRHLLSKHNRELNPIEKDVVLKLEYEGDST